ncbi:MAG: PIN domain-containing protein [Burkholderiales bacterium]|nr:PIN domain-containing protein [Burkholderiales bacterium]
MMTKPTIYMDTCCFIDMAKTALSIQTPPRREPHIFYCRKFLDAARAKDVVIYTSTMTVVECVVIKDSSKPGNPIVEDEAVRALFRGMLMSGKSGVMPVIPTPRITESARDLRWTHDITCKPIDALHLATAIDMKCSHFLTTDGRLGAENIKKIADLGLVVCSADEVANLLPSQYRQYELKPAEVK